MRFGIQLNPYFTGSTGNPWDAVARASRAVDASAFDSLWLYDHLLYEGGYSGHPHPEPVMECFTTLGAVASITNRKNDTRIKTPRVGCDPISLTQGLQAHTRHTQ